MRLPANLETHSQGARTGLPRWLHGLIFLLSCAILILRRPDAVLHAQFWSEDGHVWVADAYNLGWFHAIFRPWTGYFMTLPRLGAAVAMLVPLVRAPLVLNLIAICVQALPANLLLSERSSAWGSLKDRALLAAMYLVLPNCREVSNGITEVQWVLAFCGFLVLVARTPETRAVRFFDFLLLAMCGLTGPFCIFLCPIAIFLAWGNRERWQWLKAGIFAVTALVQVFALLFIRHSSDPWDSRASGISVLGPSLQSFIRIVGCQVYLATLIGNNGLGSKLSERLLVFLACVVISGSAIVVICFAKSGTEMRLLILLSALLFAASLVSSSVKPPPGQTIWDHMAGVPGIRYWFFPTLIFAWSLLVCVRRGSSLVKLTASYLLVLMCVGIVRDWKHPALRDLHYAEYVRRFDSAPAGTPITIPLNPPTWEMRLVKRGTVPVESSVQR
jgi:hypothetical protein